MQLKVNLMKRQTLEQFITWHYHTYRVLRPRSELLITVITESFMDSLRPEGFNKLTFLVIVWHVVCDHIAEVQKEVPCVLGNWALVMLLNAAQSQEKGKTIISHQQSVNKYLLFSTTCQRCVECNFSGSCFVVLLYLTVFCKGVSNSFVSSHAVCKCSETFW